MSKAHTDDNCWCEPKGYQICPECDDDPDEVIRTGKVIAKKDCWKCGGEGLVEPYDDDTQLIIVHQMEKQGKKR